MEKCAQCGTEARQHPVVAIMNTKDAANIKWATIPLGVDHAGHWASMPVCNSCHQAPKLKAHFVYRGEESVALRMADSKNLGQPAGGKRK